jgi:cyanate lyase
MQDHYCGATQARFAIVFARPCMVFISTCHCGSRLSWIRHRLFFRLALESYVQRKPTLELANQAARTKGLTLEALGQACNLLPIRVGAVLTGQAPLEKALQMCLEDQLGLSPGAMTALTSPPVRWQTGAIYRMHEAVEVYGPALQRWFNERYGDAIMSAIDFNVTVEETKGAKEERRIRIVFDGKALPYSSDDGWRPAN